jgi:ribosomal protein S18 acetylase RimI-like enzyme
VACAVARGNDLARTHLGVEQWHLHLLAVHPRARGGGLGLALAQAAMAEAAQRGATVFQTGVDSGAVGAQRIYARLGLLPRASSLALHRWIGGR